MPWEIYIFIIVLVLGLVGLFMYIKIPQSLPYIPDYTATIEWFDSIKNCPADLTDCISPEVTVGYDLDFVSIYRNTDEQGALIDDKIFFRSNVYSKVVLKSYEYNNQSSQDVALGISNKLIDNVNVPAGKSQKGTINANITFPMNTFIYPSSLPITDKSTMKLVVTFAKA